MMVFGEVMIFGLCYWVFIVVLDDVVFDFEGMWCGFVWVNMNYFVV